MSGTNNAWGGAYTFTALQSAGGSVQDLMHAYMTTSHGNHGRSVRPLAFDGRPSPQPRCWARLPSNCRL
jgi:hypothetical protein